MDDNMVTSDEDVQRSGHRPADLVPPPDEPVGVDERTTAAEQREGDTLGERLNRERPDRGAGAATLPAEDLVDDDPDHEKDLVAEEAESEGGREVTPEEGAMRVVDEDEAPGLTDGPDRYVEEE
ncbi:MAG TPA: hypothetical protein VM638_06090 [Actinomycetota bacterium]|nr:hypothetical protein [Actinomycetota bacterium]